MLPNEYNRVIRRGKSESGMHVYINGDVTQWALQSAGIPLSAKELECKAYACKDAKGQAKIILKIRELK